MKFLRIIHQTVCITLICCFSLCEATAQSDSVQIPRGYSVLPIPFAAYDADLGAQFGAIVLVYNYGKDLYPHYRNKIYFNGCIYSSMAGAVKLTYDSGKEFHKFRFTAHTRYSHEESAAFYGFNGSPAYVNKDWTDVSSSQYQSRLFYSVCSNQFRFITDFSLELFEKVKFVTGTSSWYVSVKEPDVSFFRTFWPNQTIPSNSEVLPLWSRYDKLGIIPANELHGGWCNYIKVAIMRDSRDFEPNPHQGSRSEVLFNVAPWGLNRWPHTKLTLSHVHFFPLHKRLTFAARGAIQSTVLGHAPYFVQPYIHSSLGFSSSSGLGGSETLRGILQNRIVADGVVLTNLELRWRAVNFKFIRKQFWLGTSVFTDAGKAIKSINFDKEKAIAQAKQQNIDFSTVFTADNQDKFHFSYGGGIKIGINETTILSGDLAFPYYWHDGRVSLYLGVDFMF